MDMSSFFQKCLDKDPAKRWSCEQLLNHGFFDRHSFKKPDYGELERRDNAGRVRPAQQQQLQHHRVSVRVEKQRVKESP